MSGFRDIEKTIKTGSAGEAGVTLLCGDELFLVEHYERRLADMLLERDLLGLGRTLFYGSDTTDEDIVAALETLPLAAEYRVVIVRDYAGLTASKGGASGASSSSRSPKPAKARQAKKSGDLTSYIKEGIPAHAKLILSCRSINRTTVLYKALSAGTAKTPAAVYDFARLGDADLKNFIVKRFRAEGVNITLELMNSFVERTGYADKDSGTDLYKVDGDAVKTAAFVRAEGRDEVTPADIETCIPPGLGADVFRMLDALSAGKKSEAVSLLTSSLALGENTFRLTNLLIGHFEIILACKEMQEKGYPLQKMADILSQKSTFRIKKLAPYTGSFTSSRLAALLAQLYSIEKEIRLGNIREDLALLTFFADA